MPDITIPNIFSDGLSADAEQVMENAYLPKLAPDNLEVINGRLTNPNRDGWTIDSSDVRRGHFSQSGQVSATANQDYFDDFLTVTATGTIGDFQYQSMAIPGCSISFYVPWQVTAVSLNWHLSVITDAAKTVPLFPGGYNFEGKTRLMLFIDGYPVPQITRKMRDGNQTMAYDSSSPGTYNNYYQKPDTRHWSGSFLYDSSVTGIIPPGTLNYIEKGWHTASIRLAFPPIQEIVLGGAPVRLPGSGIQQVRVKTRRMSYTLIR